MEKVSNVLIEFNEIITLFENANISTDLALTFIKNNLDLLIEEMDTIVNNLYFIFNNNQVYGVIYAKEDNYSWSILKGGVFPTLKHFTEEEQATLKGTDYIVEMMLRFADSDKIKIAVPEVVNMNIEQKIKTLKDIGLNSNGYHFC